MFTENLPAFFLDFGEEVEIAGTQGVAIFDNAANVVLEGMVVTSGPVLTIRQADYPTNLVGASVVIRNTNYRVVAVEPDGTGVASVRLEKL